MSLDVVNASCIVLRFAAWLCLFTTAAISAGAASAHHPDHGEPLPADTGDALRTVADIPDTSGQIIGSPEPGPPPQHRGDRGGLLQLTTLAVMAASVALIMLKVARAARVRAD